MHPDDLLTRLKMFKLSSKDSEHTNLYGEKKNASIVKSIEQDIGKDVIVKEDTALLERNNKGDDLYKFKKSTALTRKYELYL